MNAQSLLTPANVAERLNVSTRVVLRLMRTGQLEAAKVGRQWRIAPMAIDRLMVRGRFQPPAQPSQAGRTRRIARHSQEAELPLPGAEEFL